MTTRDARDTAMAALGDLARQAENTLRLERSANQDEPDLRKHNKGELHAKRCGYIDSMVIVAKTFGIDEDEAMSLVDYDTGLPEASNG